MAHKLPLADIQFISDFAAFCRTKGDDGYDFWSTDDSADGCALVQFTHSKGLTAETDDDWVPHHRLLSGVLRAKPWTFSALADRLEALIADAPVVERAQ
jgi:hypothetical protein